MVSLMKLTDTVLIIFFIAVAVTAPLDAGLCLSPSLQPDFLIHLKPIYARKFGDYLVTHKPPFFIALLWLEVLFLWPLQLLNLYGILGAKPWLSISGLVFGASYCTTMLAVLAEVIFHPVSDMLIMGYFLFIGCGLLSLLRGLLLLLLPCSATAAGGGETRTTINTTPESSGSGKKRA